MGAFEVEFIDVNNFFLRVIGTTTKIPAQEFKITGSTSGNGTYKLSSGSGDLNDLQTKYDNQSFPVSIQPSQQYINLRWLATDGTTIQTDDYFGAGVTYVWNASGSGITNGASFGDGDDREITINQADKRVSGLDHLEGKTVQVLVDDNYVTDKVVTNGEVAVEEYGSKVTAGLPYSSTLQPMPLEPSLVNKLSQSRVKAASKVIVRFYKTKGASVGEAGKQLSTYSILNTQDPAGESIELKNIQPKFFIASDYQREKLIEIRQDLPYPMTVLSLATQINAEGI